MASAEYILNLSCPDRPGVVHAVSQLLAGANCNIVDAQQFGDPSSGRFFMRIRFATTGTASTEPMELIDLERLFDHAAVEFSMEIRIKPTAVRPRVMIMVSNIGHCLNDLLYRYSVGQLQVDIPCIVSNHLTFAPLAARYNIPFHHLPVSAATKDQQETQILDLVRECKIDLVVLARYMQVLSPGLCKALPDKVINIHHSFLPSFKGAKPYHQAYDRGVKLIGATAHFVTADLDEGPIIEQRVVRVDHTMTAKDLTLEGSNVECQTLAKAVQWIIQGRVMRWGSKTVVFS